MYSRRSFIKNTALSGLALSAPSALMAADKVISFSNMSNPKISLAQWSMHRALEANSIKATDFAAIARNDYGIGAVEYVNSFYKDYGHSEKFWNQMKEHANNEEVTSLLIMVDSEGLLGNTNDQERLTAVENHYKWIHAAKILGCHSIRVNAFGEGDRDTLKSTLVNGLGLLAEYGAKVGINVLIENHGLHTSDGAYIVDIIKTVDNPYLGTLPDFGNWCLNKEWGGTQNNQCTEVYDHYRGVADFLPYAKGVSAKSYNFDENGNETMLDYKKFLQLVKDAKFEGYIGIEYEGERLSEPEGIRATKALIERAWQGLD
ncbi:sugar phosphate isomerase/epimerase family protein [Spongiimicrobium sp. 3-5]|uniref:sugar phosphate isomerase/epimerase family protein n=1 Tax=Spongiimicrobium sp. 3-5 TaxID=3332596 RepID=UPI003980E465